MNNPFNLVVSDIGRIVNDISQAQPASARLLCVIWFLQSSRLIIRVKQRIIKVLVLKSGSRNLALIMLFRNSTSCPTHPIPWILLHYFHSIHTYSCPPGPLRLKIFSFRSSRQYMRAESQHLPKDHLWQSAEILSDLWNRVNPVREYGLRAILVHKASW